MKRTLNSRRVKILICILFAFAPIGIFGAESLTDEQNSLLIHVLDSSLSSDVRNEAVLELGKSVDYEIIRHLEMCYLECLRDNRDVARQIIFTLGEIGDKETLNNLHRFIKFKNNLPYLITDILNKRLMDAVEKLEKKWPKTAPRDVQP